MILLKYKESVPDRTKITVGFGTTGVHISYMPVLSFLRDYAIGRSIVYKYRNNIEGTRTVYLES